MRIVLLGAPGAGKGTQAKRLAERFGMTHLSSGDILRTERAGGSALGERLKQYMDAGALVPDAVVVEIMAQAITRQGDGGLLLDGFPRTVVQAQALDEQLARAGRPLDVVLVIEVADEFLLDRITGRRSCGRCGHVYHVTHLRPKVEGVCDRDGSPLVQRPDDTEAVVRQRLAAYHAQTAPVIGYYDGAGKRIVRVDGSARPDDVTGRIAEALRALGSAA